ncbi:unnamed protein product [Adineta steineri]|uniref:Ras-associating domain-containing protein n=1 Tax=Adineta steineri TaxID=433720 RepID=A0A815C5E4_9BILA|nr:unnamed protein product [Adineta steineri]
MNLEIEIPIWYNGKMKWISNLTTRSKCSDVIQAILSSDENYFPQTNDNYVLYESWRGVERPLKSRCRLLKLWHSWAGESQNVTLTLRNYHQQQYHQIISTQNRIRHQEKKSKRNQKRTDKQLKNQNQSILSYLNLYRSILNTQTQIEYQQKIISCLITDIDNETRIDFNQDDLTNLLTEVNQTLIISRQLNQQSDELDEKINFTNKEIDRKQCLLDELELDYALDENIEIDSLEDDNDDDDNQDQLSFTFQQEHVSTKDASPSPPPPTIITQKKTQTVSSRPTAIVEPSLSLRKSRSFSDHPLKTRVQNISFPIRHHSPWSLSTNDESDTGISSFNSTDDQLVTLV